VAASLQVFRHRPVEVNAVQFDGTPAGGSDLIHLFAPGKIMMLGTAHDPRRTLRVYSHSGPQVARQGDWLVASDNDVVVLSDSQFRSLYEPVF
jgi:acyl-coenzyme A synthetase/AMP-(fatty) acid ligase